MLELQVQQARIDFRTAYQKYLNEKNNIELAQKIYDRTSHQISRRNGKQPGTDHCHRNSLQGPRQAYIQAMVELLNTKLALDKALGNL